MRIESGARTQSRKITKLMPNFSASCINRRAFRSGSDRPSVRRGFRALAIGAVVATLVSVVMVEIYTTLRLHDGHVVSVEDEAARRGASRGVRPQRRGVQPVIASLH